MSLCSSKCTRSITMWQVFRICRADCASWRLCAVGPVSYTRRIRVPKVVRIHVWSKHIWLSVDHNEMDDDENGWTLWRLFRQLMRRHHTHCSETEDISWTINASVGRLSQCPLSSCIHCVATWDCRRQIWFKKPELKHYIYSEVLPRTSSRVSKWCL